MTGVSFGGESLGPPGEPSGHAIVVKPFVHMDELRRSTKFSPKVLSELESYISPKHDTSLEGFEVLPFARHYLQGLSRVLGSIRNHVAEREVKWRMHIKQAVQAYDGPILDPHAFAMCMERMQDGQQIESLWIGSHPWTEIDVLRDRNPVLSYLDRAVIRS